MMRLPVEIELANVVTVERLHHADPREHRRPAFRRDQDQRLHRRLPLRRLVLGLPQLRDVRPGILERDDRAAVGSDRRMSASSPCQSSMAPAIFVRRDLGDSPTSSGHGDAYAWCIFHHDIPMLHWN
jgi:hypothetical protein